MMLNEALKRVRFSYSNYKTDPQPEVKVLDFKYGKDKDILGYNINYYSNKEDAAEGFDAIDDFARLINSDDKERYNRIRDFFDKSNISIRRYKRKHISDVEEVDRDKKPDWWIAGKLKDNKDQFEE
jgi:hypothetical protein